MESNVRMRDLFSALSSRSRIVGAIAATSVLAATLICAPPGQAQTKAPLKVAYIPCGRVNDQSWSQAGYEGILAAKKELGIEVAYSESVQPADVEAAARDYASKGYDLVMLHCGTFTDPGLKVAKDFPKVWFEVTSARTPVANVISLNFAQQEATFVAGVMAGLTTKTNRLGAIASYNTLGFNRQIEGFRLGAKFANPKTELYVTYLNSAEDAAKAKEAALAQFDAGADIILAATDQAATGVFRAGTDREKLIVAEYADQNALAPKTIVASVLYSQARLVQGMITSVASGKAKGEILEPGISEGVGSLVENKPLFDALPKDAQECTHLVFADIEKGKLKIPDQITMGKQNAAKSMDPKIVLTSDSHPCFNKQS
jgi:basic membrane protein A